MRIFLALICSIALACAVGAQEPQKKEKKKGATAGQVSKPGGKPAGVGKPAGQPTGMGKPAAVGKAKGKPAEVGKPKGVGKPATVGKTKGKPSEVRKPSEVGTAPPLSKPTKGGKPTVTSKPTATGKAKGKPMEVGKPATAGKAKGKAGQVGKPMQAGTVAAPRKPAKAGKPTVTGKPAVAGGGTAGKPYKPQHFNLPTKTTPTQVASVNFQQGRHIKGSQNWQGSSYTVFRNYTPQWHDQVWWTSHYNRVAFVYGGWYYWNAGFWFPAWGYAPNAFYAYDGPIYGYNSLPPDQVIANVQAALQQQGYYQGEVDGLLGPLTRTAIADYQRDHGLYETAAIDRPTLASLGLA